MPNLLLASPRWGRGLAGGAASSREPWRGPGVWAGSGAAPIRAVPAPTQPRLPAPLSRSSRWFSGSSWSFSLHEVEEKFTWSPTKHRLLSGMRRPGRVGLGHTGVPWEGRWGVPFAPSQPRSRRIAQAAASSCPIIPPASVTVCHGGTEPTSPRQPEPRECPDTHGAQGFPSDPSSAPRAPPAPRTGSKSLALITNHAGHCAWPDLP